jgi:hypothetical protein
VSIIRNAIMEDDNVNVNVGYLCLFLVMALVLLVIPVMVCAAIVQTWFDEHHVFPFSELGKGAGFITGAFSTALAALGLFLWGDRRPVPPALTTTTTAGPGGITTSTVQTPPPQLPAQDGPSRP